MTDLHVCVYVYMCIHIPYATLLKKYSVETDYYFFISYAYFIWMVFFLTKLPVE